MYTDSPFRSWAIILNWTPTLTFPAHPTEREGKCSFLLALLVCKSWSPGKWLDPYPGKKDLARAWTPQKHLSHFTLLGSRAENSPKWKTSRVDYLSSFILKRQALSLLKRTNPLPFNPSRASSLTCFRPYSNWHSSGISQASSFQNSNETNTEQESSFWSLSNTAWSGGRER